MEFCEELFDAEISRIVGILRSSMMSTVLEAWLKSKMGESLMFELLWQKSFVNIIIDVANIFSIIPLIRIRLHYTGE